MSHQSKLIAESNYNATSRKREPPTFYPLYYQKARTPLPRHDSVNSRPLQVFPRVASGL